mmetsp:Transcript_32789/g.59420  ORF Transcript_32789/g.59420 Transcript_32789/m.59420 type:complete len:209 (+) Transcript_32789:243-869(+)
MPWLGRPNSTRSSSAAGVGATADVAPCTTSNPVNEVSYKRWDGGRGRRRRRTSNCRSSSRRPMPSPCSGRIPGGSGSGRRTGRIRSRPGSRIQDPVPEWDDKAAWVRQEAPCSRSTCSSSAGISYPWTRKWIQERPCCGMGNWHPRNSPPGPPPIRRRNPRPSLRRWKRRKRSRTVKKKRRLQRELHMRRSRSGSERKRREIDTNLEI